MIKKSVFLGIILIFSFALVGCAIKSPVSKTLVVNQPANTPQTKLIDIILIFKYDNREDNYNLKIEKGKTVFDLLKLSSEKNNFSLEYQNYDIGVFIKAIKGIKNGKDNKYWQYTVNSRYADKAADNWPLKDGDVIEWSFTKSQF